MPNMSQVVLAQGQMTGAVAAMLGGAKKRTTRKRRKTTTRKTRATRTRARKTTRKRAAPKGRLKKGSAAAKRRMAQLRRIKARKR